MSTTIVVRLLVALIILAVFQAAVGALWMLWSNRSALALRGRLWLRRRRAERTGSDAQKVAGVDRAEALRAARTRLDAAARAGADLPGVRPLRNHDAGLGGAR